PTWPKQLAAWGRDLPRPKAILIVSAHWESAPLTIGATKPVALVYDYYGSPERYYRVRYPAPVAPALAARVREPLSGGALPVRAHRASDHRPLRPALRFARLGHRSSVRGPLGDRRIRVGSLETLLRDRRARGDSLEPRENPYARGDREVELNDHDERDPPRRA